MIARLALPIAMMFLAGCASVPGFSLKHARVDAVTPEYVVLLDGEGKTVIGGAAKGTATGFGIGILGCMGAGPLMPLCLSAVMPAMLATGAVVGAAPRVMNDSEEELRAKRAALLPVHAANLWPARLAATMHERDYVARADGAAPQWSVRFARLDLQTHGRGTGAAFKLSLIGIVEVRAEGSSQVLATRIFQTRAGENSRTLEQWTAGDGAELRAEFDLLASALAVKVRCGFPDPLQTGAAPNCT